MTITEQKYELLNINCILLNIATLRQPYLALNWCQIYFSLSWLKVKSDHKEVCCAYIFDVGQVT